MNPQHFRSQSELKICSDWQPVKVFKSLNSRQSVLFLKFQGKEGAHPIQTMRCRFRTAQRSRRAVSISSPTLGSRSAERAKPGFVTLGYFLGRLPVTIQFKSLNDRQSDMFLELKESKEPIQFKLSDVDQELLKFEKNTRLAVI